MSGRGQIGYFIQHVVWLDMVRSIRYLTNINHQYLIFNNYIRGHSTYSKFSQEKNQEYIYKSLLIKSEIVFLKTRVTFFGVRPNENKNRVYCEIHLIL